MFEAVRHLRHHLNGLRAVNVSWDSGLLVPHAVLGIGDRLFAISSDRTLIEDFQQAFGKAEWNSDGSA
jgi:hypothetical protein